MWQLINELCYCFYFLCRYPFRYLVSSELLLFNTPFLIKRFYLLLYCCTVTEEITFLFYTSLSHLPVSPHSHLLAAHRNATCRVAQGWGSKSFPSHELPTLHVFIVTPLRSFNFSANGMVAQFCIPVLFGKMLEGL